jgi:hypothetical protein
VHPGFKYVPQLTQIQGIYPAFPGNVTWLSVNMAGDYKRAAGMAIYIGLGNLAGGKNTSIGGLGFKLMIFTSYVVKLLPCSRCAELYSRPLP